MYIAPDNPTEDKNSIPIERPFLFAHVLQVSKWYLRNLILYTFFFVLLFYTCILPWGKDRQILGVKMLMSTESSYHFDHFLRKNLFEFRFIHIFSCFSTCIYSPGQPFVDKILMSTERPCHLAHLLQVSKQYLWSLILYIFLPIFKHIYSPWAGADNILGSEFWFKHKHLSLWSFAVSFIH